MAHILLCSSTVRVHDSHDFVALCGKIPHPCCVPSDSVSQSVTVSICPLVALGLVIMNSKSAHHLGCQEISGTEDIKYIKIQ